MQDDADIAIIGAGIAGASLAWRLAQAGAQVLLLEREAQPGYHSTGRSAAMFMESYGPPQVRALTRASRAFYEAPPPGFASSPIMAARGVLYVAGPGQTRALEELQAELQAHDKTLQRLDAAQALRRCPVLRAEWLECGLWEPAATDLDVHALHGGYLRGLAQARAPLQCGSELAQAWHAGGQWHLRLASQAVIRARVVVNAAGAWADEVARLCGVPPIGLQPKRRAAFRFKAPEGLDVGAWPATVSVDESCYFKPDAGQLLGSPANADPTHPHDVQPEELDIATGIHHLEAMTTLSIRRPTSTWAGLRSFTPDGELALGFEPATPGFFWLAGQGGYGIQSAAGASLLAQTLLLGQALPEALRSHGVVPELSSPVRFR